MPEELFDKFMCEWRDRQNNGCAFFEEDYCWPPIEQTSILEALRMYTIWLKEKGHIKTRY